MTVICARFRFQKRRRKKKDEGEKRGYSEAYYSAVERAIMSRMASTEGKRIMLRSEPATNIITRHGNRTEQPILNASVSVFVGRFLQQPQGVGLGDR